ncbi:MAG: gliding motility-associated C-terminal domain-containing protein [Ferruginibacter sp.]
MKILWISLLFISTIAYGQASDPSIPILPTKTNKPVHDPPEVINVYTEVLSLNRCDNSITIVNDSAFKIGDTVLLIQMKGALIDTSNSASFGSIIDYKSAGNYQFNSISAKSGNKITLRNIITRSYEIPDGAVQLIRVPFLKSAAFPGGLTCLPWDGSKGGVLAVIAENGLNSYAEIEVSGKGFKGGQGYYGTFNSGTCFENNYNYSSATLLAGFKGESITTISPNISKGKGSPAAGGGGGLSHNSGGGGGGNGGSGGTGGYQTDTCGNAPFANGGIGGRNLLYTNSTGKIFMGSGGGAGHSDNNDLTTTAATGGSGGGIIFIIADTLNMFSHEIFADGSAGQYCYATDCNDGMGGGGAGGSVVLKTQVEVQDLIVEASAGNGANMQGSSVIAGYAGPGGGGGGGMILLNSPGLPLNANLYVNGGGRGVMIGTGGNAWGATTGADGKILFNYAINLDTIPFVANIDSVLFSDSIISCNNVLFQGLAFTNTAPIVTWQWSFGDGEISSGQNTNHNYNVTGTYPVQLIVVDINGCKDSVISPVMTAGLIFASAGNDTSLCSNGAVMVTLNGNGSGTYSWSPAGTLNNNTIPNPTATVIDSINKYYLTVTNGIGCTATDSVTITVNQKPKVFASKANDINCKLPFSRLNAIGANEYTWKPMDLLDNAFHKSPLANPITTTTFIVTGIDRFGCNSQDSITVVVNFDTKGFELPNSFTPNGDGINDCFGIKFYRDVTGMRLMIYNRYGEQVFASTDSYNCWDGLFRGQPVPNGNYIYYLRARTLCGEISKKGNVLVIR